MKKIVVLLAVSAIVAGCATAQQQIDSQAPVMNSWVGASIDEFVAMQGTPTKVVDKVDYQIFIFDARKAKTRTETQRSCEPTTEIDEPQRCQTDERYLYTVTFRCTYGLVVVETIITDWQMEGNNCEMITVNQRPG